MEEILSEFNIYSKNRAFIINFRNSSCRCRVPIPKGTIIDRVKDILSGSETDCALQKAHRDST
jgi:hypothetical protein